MGAGRVALAKITFDNFIVHLIHQRTSKGASGNTSHTFYTSAKVKFNRSRFFVSSQGVKKAGFDTGGIIALQTGNGNIFIFGMRQRVDAASSRFEISGVAESTGQLAGTATGAQPWLNYKAVLHWVASSAETTILPIVFDNSIRLQSSHISK